MIRYIAVHCSATKPSMDIGAAEIDAWHKARGWTGIGYNLVIRRDGRLETGRREGDTLSHAVGYNSNSVAVCMVGGVNEHNAPSYDYYQSEQWKTLRTVLDFWRLKYPQAQLLGHRDFPDVAKDCPSFDVRRWYAGGAIMDARKRV